MDAETVAILFFLATLAVLAAYAAWRRWPRLVRYKIDYDVEPEVPDSRSRPYSAASG